MYVDPCHHRMARSRVVDGRYSLQKWRANNFSP